MEKSSLFQWGILKISLFQSDLKVTAENPILVQDNKKKKDTKQLWLDSSACFINPNSSKLHQAKDGCFKATDNPGCYR